MRFRVMNCNLPSCIRQTTKTFQGVGVLKPRSTLLYPNFVDSNISKEQFQVLLLQGIIYYENNEPQVIDLAYSIFIFQCPPLLAHAYYADKRYTEHQCINSHVSTFSSGIFRDFQYVNLETLQGVTMNTLRCLQSCSKSNLTVFGLSEV